MTPERLEEGIELADRIVRWVADRVNDNDGDYPWPGIKAGGKAMAVILGKDVMDAWVERSESTNSEGGVS